MKNLGGPVLGEIPKKQLYSGIPLQRWGTKKEIADAAIFLCSDAAVKLLFAFNVSLISGILQILSFLCNVHILFCSRILREKCWWWMEDSG